MAFSRAVLTVSDENNAKREFLFSSNILNIGRSPDNQLCLDYQNVSRHHASIELIDGEYNLTDLGSSTGTRCNSEDLLPRVPKILADGDNIRIGSFAIQFSLTVSSSVPQQKTMLISPTVMLGVGDKTVVNSFENSHILQVITPQWQKDFPLLGQITIGRDPNSDIVIDVPTVSALHARLKPKNDSYEILDVGATNGLTYEGKRITARDLVDGDVISIGFNITFTYRTSNPQILADSQAPVQLLDLRSQKKLKIGRDAENDTVIDHPSVSRFHAQIENKNGSLVLTDLESSNGTFVNGKQITQGYTLKAGDVIQISPCRFVLNSDATVTRYNEAGNLRLDAVNLTKVVGKGKILLDDISLSIWAKEFVVIAGVSGGGKSTLLDALNGFRPATSGSVLVNNNDLYKSFNAYRTELGYVPQKDIVHMELTIEQALDYAAQLRMPVDTTKAERNQRIEEVLDDLGLKQRRDVPIKDLSGGQLKRVSMGVELLTKPSLFFLDEATSGLDPGTEADIMRLLRDLADQGRTVLLITHATENVMICDLVVFLAAGGRVAYFGPPDQAAEYFGVKKFNEIYPKVEREIPPEVWQEKYKKSPQYQKYVVDRQKDLEKIESTPRSQVKQQAPAVKTKQVSAWRQFLILSSRNFAILARDRASLILMLAIAPILGLLDFATWKRDIFNINTGDPGQAVTMLFTTGLISVMVGSLATMREIVKEVDIYKRERMIGLMSIPYILSKVLACFVLAIYQSAVFLTFKNLAVQIPGNFFTMYITLFLATMAGMMMGLLVSAISPNQNMAPLLTIIVLVPQIIFGGGILPVREFGPPGQLINQVSLTKWPFETLVTVTEFGTKVAADRCWQVTEAEQKKYSDDYKQKNCDCLGPKMFERCEFPGLKSKYDKEAKNAVEGVEPVKPKSPGAIPNDPREFDNYKKKVDKYDNQIKDWQEKFSKWKSKRESAIGGSEALINRFYRDFGTMFNINIYRHWGAMGILILSMFVALIFVQKRKDTV